MCDVLRDSSSAFVLNQATRTPVQPADDLGARIAKVRSNRFEFGSPTSLALCAFRDSIQWDAWVKLPLASTAPICFQKSTSTIEFVYCVHASWPCRHDTRARRYDSVIHGAVPGASAAWAPTQAVEASASPATSPWWWWWWWSLNGIQGELKSGLNKGVLLQGRAQWSLSCIAQCRRPRWNRRACRLAPRRQQMPPSSALPAPPR